MGLFDLMSWNRRAVSVPATQQDEKCPRENAPVTLHDIEILRQRLTTVRTENRNLRHQCEVRGKQQKASNEKIKELDQALLRVDRELESQRRSEIQKVDELTRALHQAREEQRKALIVDKAKTEQHDHLLRQAREEASRSAKCHQEELNKLYNKLNTLQCGQANLGDDQIIDRMRSLNQNLESWVKVNFKDITKQISSTGLHGNGFPSTASQQRACVQVYITSLVYGYIFLPYQVGLDDKPCGHVLSWVEASVAGACSDTVRHTWRMATSVAMEAASRDSCEAIYANVINWVEGQFGILSSTSAESRRRQLREFLGRCAEFRIALNQHKQTFFFYCSPGGTEFCPKAMTFGGGDGQPEGKVRCSLWPAIVRRGDKNVIDILEPELVWTMH
ncbi:hypothetical protein BO71DRAFT_372001 [Aspergillus ellipticus CBS 707.79]|uniref:Uncharacterized protein n=1 Tax=Aspergillus ellipticus CBS 707.79 TaxID=1448320 RepID=A0A319DNA2_9EURO|nr:hypothetical protein BO71DRAFT_372001 [Aspergillus ellipticus CBS 707.79]